MAGGKGDKNAWDASKKRGTRVFEGASLIGHEDAGTWGLIGGELDPMEAGGEKPGGGGRGPPQSRTTATPKKRRHPHRPQRGTDPRGGGGADPR